jgi:hypothetical protein
LNSPREVWLLNRMPGASAPVVLTVLPVTVSVEPFGGLGSNASPAAPDPWVITVLFRIESCPPVATAPKPLVPVVVMVTPEALSIPPEAATTPLPPVVVTVSPGFKVLFGGAVTVLVKSVANIP